MFVREINVHERESRMCGEGKVCVCDNGFESGVWGKSEFVGENEIRKNSRIRERELRSLVGGECSMCWYRVAKTHRIP